MERLCGLVVHLKSLLLLRLWASEHLKYTVTCFLEELGLSGDEATGGRQRQSRLTFQVLQMGMSHALRSRPRSSGDPPKACIRGSGGAPKPLVTFF